MNLTKRQQQIVEAAMSLIAQKGIQGLTIKNISLMVGISEPAIYRHFKSKTDILLTILDMFIENNKRIFISDVKKDIQVYQVIENLFNNFINTFIEYPDLISVIFSEEIFNNDPVFKKKTLTIINGNFEILKKLIKKGQINNEINPELDAESLATIILGSLRLCVKKWQLSGFNYDLKIKSNILKKNILKLISN